MFAFFLESAFIGALIWGEKRLGPRLHFLAALAVAVGSWLSAYFILVTNAFMQHPVGYRIAEDGSLSIDSLSAYLLNPWVRVQYAHNQMAALVTGSFVVAALGAFYCLRGVHSVQAQMYLRAGTIVGLIASILVAFPTGDQQAKMVSRHQPVTLAAMEGRFNGGPRAGVALIGQPNVAAQRLDNPIEMPGALSFLANGHFGSNVSGLNDFPRESWPDNIELLYYSFHLMNARDDFYRPDGLCRIPEPARPAGIQPRAALGADAGVPVSLPRQHVGVDDDGAGTPTLARLRSLSHIARP
jgi:cytochrome bd ubiquinol oxidase subunit I